MNSDFDDPSPALAQGVCYSSGLDMAFGSYGLGEKNVCEQESLSLLIVGSQAWQQGFQQVAAMMGGGHVRSAVAAPCNSELERFSVGSNLGSAQISGFGLRAGLEILEKACPDRLYIHHEQLAHGIPCQILIVFQ
jgi:hypothetical protein